MLAAIGASSLLLRSLAENDQLWREVWHLMRLPVRQLPESQVGLGRGEKWRSAVAANGVEVTTCGLELDEDAGDSAYLAYLCCELGELWLGKM